MRGRNEAPFKPGDLVTHWDSPGRSSPGRSWVVTKVYRHRLEWVVHVKGLDGSKGFEIEADYFKKVDVVTVLAGLAGGSMKRLGPPAHKGRATWRRRFPRDLANLKELTDG